MTTPLVCAPVDAPMGAKSFVPPARTAIFFLNARALTYGASVALPPVSAVAAVSIPASVREG